MLYKGLFTERANAAPLMNLDSVYSLKACFDSGVCNYQLQELATAQDISNLYNQQVSACQ